MLKCMAETTHALALGIVIVATTLACGSTAPSSPARVASVVLTDSGCTSDLGLVLGRLEFDLINDTPNRADFAIMRLREGHSYDELVLIIAEDNQRLSRGEATVEPSEVAALLKRIALAEAGHERVQEELIPGTYTVVCVRASLTPQKMMIASGSFVIR